MSKWILPGLLMALLWGCRQQQESSDAYGNFEAEEITVAAESAGRLLFFDTREGEKLQAGALVAYVDTASVFLKLKALEARLGTVDARAASVTAKRKVLDQQIKNVAKEVNRVSGLLERHAATQKAWDEVTGNLKVLKARREELEVQRHTALQEKTVIRAEMESVKEQLRKCFVHNPSAGTVVETYVHTGEWVVPGKPLYKIADLSVMTLRVYVDEPLLSEIKIGDEVTVLFDGEDGILEETTGRIAWIANEAEFTPKIIQTRRERVNLVYAVKIHVKNDGRLKIGMPGEAKF